MKRPMGTEKISISIPTDLLQIVDRVAGDKEFSRSCFISFALRKYVLHHLYKKDWLWDTIYNRHFDK